jgi:diadenylate cyclase
VTFQEVIQVIHRTEMVLRIKNEILNYVNELGTEGRLIRLQMKELVANIEEEAALLMKDYSKDDNIDPYKALRSLQQLSNNELLNSHAILKLLGYHYQADMEEEAIAPRGYRLLNKIPRMPPLIIQNLVSAFYHFNNILKATSQELEQVDGIGGVRARKIKEGLNRIQEQLIIDRHI